MSKKSYLMTDTRTLYRKLGKKFRDHETVNHRIEEYVRGDAHVNNGRKLFLDPEARHLTASITTSAHEHLPLPCRFDFRYNARTALVSTITSACRCGQGHRRQAPYLSAAS